MPARLTYRRAQELEAEAKRAGAPTPRNAAALLIRDDAAELARLEREAAKVKRRVTERMLRQNYQQREPGGPGLPERHPDRISLRELGELIGKDAMQADRWMARYIAKPTAGLPAGHPPNYNHSPAPAP